MPERERPVITKEEFQEGRNELAKTRDVFVITSILLQGLTHAPKNANPHNLEKTGLAVLLLSSWMAAFREQEHSIHVIANYKLQRRKPVENRKQERAVRVRAAAISRKLGYRQLSKATDESIVDPHIDWAKELQVKMGVRDNRKQEDKTKFKNYPPIEVMPE